MDTLMNAGCVAPRKVAIVASCLCLALQICLAQKNSANAPGGTRAVLVEKALAMESRGRPDMAVQIWQQILLADPTNTEALAGLAKDYKLICSIDNANEALERLRKINPNDPNIPKIEAQTSSRNQSDQLRHASELARRGNADDAMRIYSELYGDHQFAVLVHAHRFKGCAAVQIYGLFQQRIFVLARLRHNQLPQIAAAG